MKRIIRNPLAFSILVGYSENHGPSRLFAWKGKKKGGKRKNEKAKKGKNARVRGEREGERESCVFLARTRRHYAARYRDGIHRDEKKGRGSERRETEGDTTERAREKGSEKYLMHSNFALRDTRYS